MKNSLRYNIASFCLIICFFVAAVFSFNNNEPWTIGDGYEYILQTAAFQNHFSFGITSDDLELAKEQFYEHQDMLEKTFNSLAIGNNGLSYSNHYGIYSALVTPVVIILNLLNIYPIYAFQITNVLLWFIACIIVFWKLKINAKKKFGLLLLLLFNPVFFYLTWIHTELYLYSFLVIGLTFYYNNKHSLGILFVSIGAMQNIGLIPVAMIIGLDYIAELYTSYISREEKHSVWRFVKESWIKIVPYGFFYLPALIPMITCYLHFGVLNRVAEVAMEKEYLLSKAKDYLFDLNLGILPYEPLILIAFFVMCICGMVKKRRCAFLNFLAVCLMLLIVSFERQINCGMEGIMRYNVWIIPSMIFFVVINFQIKESMNWKFWGTIGGEALFTAGMVIYTIWGCADYNSYLQFAPWTKAVLDVAPYLYNPSHGIFYSRVDNEEKYYDSEPVVYTNNMGYVRKVLLSSEAEGIFYGDSFILIDSDENITDKSSLRTYAVDDGKFKYINLLGDVKWVNRYTLGENIIFNLDGFNADKYIYSGLSVPEEWGTWTDGDILEARFWIDEESPLITCTIDVEAAFHQAQDVSILINNKEVYSNVIEGKQKIEFTFENPGTKVIEFTIILPNSISPSEVTDSIDSRDLGIGLLSMKFSEPNK